MTGNVGVHSCHCCVKHGCKYGDEDCPVVLREVMQDYPCEECSEDGTTLAECHLIFKGGTTRTLEQIMADFRALNEELRRYFEEAGARASRISEHIHVKDG